MQSAKLLPLTGCGFDSHSGLLKNFRKKKRNLENKIKMFAIMNGFPLLKDLSTIVTIGSCKFIRIVYRISAHNIFVFTEMELSRRRHT